MSRAGTPTDNPKMESINGWIKDEIINECKNNYNNVNYCNKQKSLCEYIDLTRVSSSNINIDVKKSYSKKILKKI